MRRLFHITVAVLVIAGGTYLFLFVRGLLFEAQMSLGIIRQKDPGLRSQIVNKESYLPPADGLLRPSQIMVLHEISRHLDSMASGNAPQREVDAQLVYMLNRFTMSASEYQWVRNSATRLMLTSRKSGLVTADSANSRRLAMILKDVSQFRRFYRDSLDRGLL